MDCQFCGTENPENAVYCKNCGKRIDGLTVCPVCNNLVPADGTYCTNCGARLDGKQVCEKCGNVYEGHFCPSCGTEAKKTTKSKRPEQTEDEALWQKILRHGSAGFALLTAVCSLIFVFFIGCSLGDSKLITGIAAELGLQDSLNLYYYFGEIYEEIDETINGMGYCPDIVVISTYCGAVLRTLISAGVLIAVAVFGILTIVRFAISYATGKQKNICSTAFATFLSYVAGATLFLASNAIDVKSKTSSVSISVSVGYNGATIAGLAVCGIFAAIGVICLLVRRGKPMITKKNIVNLSLTALMFAFLSALIGICAQSPISFQIKSSSSTDTISLGLLHLSEMIPALSPNSSRTEEGFAFSFVSFIMIAAAVILAVIIMIRMLSNATEGKSRTGLPLVIAAFLVCIVCVVFAILAANDFVAIYNGLTSTGANKMEASYAGVIAICVLGALVMITAIAHQITKYCMKKSA